MSSALLPFPLQAQMQSLWNWAAVTASVALYYSPEDHVTQCGLANWAFGQSNCCNSPVPGTCNQPYPLSSALAHCFVLGMYTAGSMSFARVKSEIDAKRPVCLSIQWTGGMTRHSVVIVGYDDTIPGNETIDICDTWYGNSISRFRDFPSNYQCGGVWANSYTTQSPQQGK